MKEDACDKAANKRQAQQFGEDALRFLNTRRLAD
jgi:hypothetical protein